MKEETECNFLNKHTHDCSLKGGFSNGCDGQNCIFTKILSGKGGKGE